ncbi:hypothetical protein [Haliangium sp.]|uniref:hypothetical protein n=1 Tax=Haliangium sp. TaxID=2663208 RepID=UPI003D13A779
MARNLSWIDPEQLASLIEVVSPATPEQEGAESADENEFSFESALFDGPQAEPPVSRPKVSAPPVSRPKVSASPAIRPAAPATVPASIPAAAPAPAVSAPAGKPFSPSVGADLGARLEDYVAWVVPATHSRGVLITDAQGLLVIERGAGDIEAAMTSSVDLMLTHLADVVQEADAVADGYLALQYEGIHLSTLWAPTEFGRFYGVLISETALPAESLAMAGQGLRSLFAN